jgi:MFS family permease
MAPPARLNMTDEAVGWAWVHVIVAALAMVATLPGRSHGLGLVTEPLMGDLQLGRVEYANINLWATLLGALFCLPCGWLIDRLGPRVMLLVVPAALGGVVILMSRIPAGWGVLEVAAPWSAAGTITLALGLFVFAMLTRGLGQSALSVVSLALMGKSAGRRAGLAYGIYSLAIAVGFGAAFKLCGVARKEWGAGWRELWAGIGAAVLVFSLGAFWLVRPSVLNAEEASAPPAGHGSDEGPSLTLGQALRTPTFWVFGLGTSFYLLISSGILFFHESILKERGFGNEVFMDLTALMPLVGLAGNLATGWLARRWGLDRLLAVAMLLLAAALALYPLVETLTQVYLYAVALGLVGGMVTVIFFAVWARAFGKLHLGKIQGVAQMLTVLASAVGPLLFAATKELVGRYVPLFYALAPLCAAFGTAAWLTPLPSSGRR